MVMRPKYSLHSIIAAAFAAGSLANLATMLRIAPLEPAISIAFFASHACVVFAFQLAIALVLAGRLENRLWTAVAFTFPIALTGLALLYATLGVIWSAGLAGLISLVVVAWCLMSGLRGAPIVAAAAGSLVSTEIVRFRSEEVANDTMTIGAAAVLGLWILGGFVVALFAGRASTGVRFPRAKMSWALGGGGLLLGLMLVALDVPPPPEMPPTGVVNSERSPVVLIVLDTVRADHLDLYGYERETMPRLTEFADKEGVIVRNAYSNGGWSLPTHASLFTGLHPPDHGAHGPFEEDPNKPRTGGYQLDDSIPTLSELLARAGYWTVGVSANSAPLSDLSYFPQVAGVIFGGFREVGRRVGREPAFAGAFSRCGGCS
jgi:hypothetical protein